MTVMGKCGWYHHNVLLLNGRAGCVIAGGNSVFSHIDYFLCQGWSPSAEADTSTMRRFTITCRMHAFFTRLLSAHINATQNKYTWNVKEMTWRCFSERQRPAGSLGAVLLLCGFHNAHACLLQKRFCLDSRLCKWKYLPLHLGQLIVGEVSPKRRSCERFIVYMSDASSLMPHVCHYLYMSRICSCYICTEVELLSLTRIYQARR